MLRSYRTSLALLLAVGLSACGDQGGPSLSSSDLAGAGDLRLTIEEAAEMLAPVGNLPADPEVVRALSEFWTDYALLALAANQEGGFDNVDLTSILEPQGKESMVLQLRDQVIDDSIVVDDAELARVFEEDRPGEEVRARHILLLFPPDATQAQLDSVRTLASDLRDQAVAGANFEALATEWSEDPGSAQRGGDLDYFPRGVMVGPFEEAAFSTPPGQVADEVIETQYGLHILRVEDFRAPSLDEIREDLRASIQQNRVLQAESIYVATVESDANVVIEDEATQRMRDAAEVEGNTLPRRMGSQALARFEGGSFTVADFFEFLTNRPVEIRGQVASASDEELRGLLDNLVRSEVLVAEARRLGIEPDSSEAREITEGIRDQYRQIAEGIGVLPLEREEGESLNQAAQRTVRAILEQVIRGEVDVFPLEGLALPLRSQFGTALSEEALEQTATRVQELRDAGAGGDAPASPAPPAPPTDVPPPPAPSDTPPSEDPPSDDGI